MIRETKVKYPVVVPGVGPKPAPGMIVGEAPGRNEIEQGIPFCGRSGALLDEALGVASISRSELYITNVYKGDVGSGNRNPNPDEIQDHWPLLEMEVDSVRPNAILLLGRIAGEAFFAPLGRMGAIVGQVGRWAGYEAMVLYHPAYVLRGGYSRQVWISDVGRFVERIRSEG